MKPVRLYSLFLIALMVPASATHGQSTYVNPVIPGDHPDPTLTRIGDNYYTSGSSFNVTPKIYHSTDLVWRQLSWQRRHGLSARAADHRGRRVERVGGWLN